MKLNNILNQERINAIAHVLMVVIQKHVHAIKIIRI